MSCLKRNRIHVVISYIILLSLILGISSCEQRKHNNLLDPDYEGATQATMNKENRTGTLKVIPGSILKTTDLKVVTFSNTSDLEANGQFSVQTNEAEKYQILFFIAKASKRPVYLGLYNPLTNKVMANDTSTALSLVLFNPYLIYTTQAQRTQYLDAVKKSNKFTQLLTLLKNAHLSNANLVLDYNTNPIIYQIICQLMKEALASLGANGSPITPIASDPPTIKDAPGEDIIFVNPRQIYYAAGIYPGENTLKEVITVNRKPTTPTYQWGWPPVIQTTTEET